MQRLFKEAGCVCHFHESACIHHANAITDVFHHTQVMGDKEIGQPHLLLQVLQQVDGLRGDGHIQC